MRRGVRDQDAEIVPCKVRFADKPSYASGILLLTFFIDAEVRQSDGTVVFHYGGVKVAGP